MTPEIWHGFAGRQTESSDKSWRPAAAWQEKAGSGKARAKESHSEGTRKVCASFYLKIFAVMTPGAPGDFSKW
jgi:hypothetical protein